MINPNEELHEILLDCNIIIMIHRYGDGTKKMKSYLAKRKRNTSHDGLVTIINKIRACPNPQAMVIMALEKFEQEQVL